MDWKYANSFLIAATFYYKEQNIVAISLAVKSGLKTFYLG